jgi:hypothetical protein
LRYRWTRVVPGFDMPVRVTIGGGTSTLLRPTSEWQTLTVERAGEVVVDPNFYVEARPVSP